MFNSCALLPSPELLSYNNSSGSDKTNTLEDFYNFYGWANDEKHVYFDLAENTSIMTDRTNDLDRPTYDTLIRSAFEGAFVPIRDFDGVAPGSSKQLLIWYYAGHGVGENICDQHYSATPLLNVNGWDGSEIYQGNGYVCERIKGGELFLHHVGFCNLRALIQPWIVAVETDSSNVLAGQKKEDKHLVVILDSCYSGVQADDLQAMVNDHSRPWHTHKNCSVTVQTSCGSDESVDGGYFTPLFLYLNKKENQSQLEDLENEWGKCSEEERDAYNKLPGSSPMVATTISPSTREPVFKIEFPGHNSTLNLFPDPRFFKFCYYKVSERGSGANSGSPENAGWV